MNKIEQEQEKDDNNTNIINLYDKKYYPNDIFSIILLILYFPIGLSLLIIRLIIIIIILPNIKNQNGTIFKILTKILGIIPITNNNNHNQKLQQPSIIISNHLTCFDFILLKNQFQNIILFQDNLNYYKTKNSNFLNKILFLNYDKNNQKKNDDLTVCVFPEIESTNGKYGLLDFNSQIFESFIEEQQQHKVIVPVCLTADYCLLPFSVRPRSSTAFSQLIVTLFSPAVLYKIQILDEIRLNTEDKITGSELAKQLQAKIGERLKLKCTKLTISDSKPRENTDPEPIDHDLKKLIQQINEILPDIPVNTIRDHIRQAQTLDIDSLITGLLEKVELKQENNKKPVIVTQQPQPTTPSKPKKVYTYAERKRTLIEETRNRYLMKQQKSNN